MSIATRPPMGWNSWDCYGSTVTEQEVLANARFMAEHLLPFGWDTQLGLRFGVHIMRGIPRQAVDRDLPTSPAASIDLLTNPEVLEVLSGSADNREVLRDGDLIVWTATGTAPQRPGSRYAALFWLGEEPQQQAIPLRSFGAGPSDTVTDLWTGETLPRTSPDLHLRIDRHGTRLLRLDKQC